MFSDVFMAVTSQEMHRFAPKRTAYMACHFSPGGLGLSNLPCSLPPDSLLLIDDSMPVQGHDPKTVISQLNEMIRSFSVKAVLLDFQRAFSDESCEMVGSIAASCACPVAVTPSYAHIEGCDLFLPPVAVNMALSDYLNPWLGRGIYLEIAREQIQITVTETGSQTNPDFLNAAFPLINERLHCHYNVSVFPEKAEFTLTRTPEDLAALTQEAYALGVQGVVGLYQELQTYKNPLG